MKILVTGAAGYIGSHALVALHQAGYSVVALDSLINSSQKALDRVALLTGAPVPFVHADVRDQAALRAIFAEHSIDAVMHFAGLKAVGESAEQPLSYYQANVAGALNLLEVMQEAGVHRLVFSSSATVYGNPAVVPIPESASADHPANPYGRCKRMIEQICQDLAAAEPQWAIGLLRYFNPVGAHPSGLLGEDPHGVPNNLVPYISQVAVGRRPALQIFGDDYPTPDGTGVRDYIHVMDLVRGHIAALAYLTTHTGCPIWNLGTGRGYSVREVVAAYEQVSEQTIPVNLCPRRAGDIATCYADASKAAAELGWQAEHDLPAMLADAWRWQQQNPQGYAG